MVCLVEIRVVMLDILVMLYLLILQFALFKDVHLYLANSNHFVNIDKTKKLIFLNQ